MSKKDLSTAMAEAAVEEMRAQSGKGKQKALKAAQNAVFGAGWQKSITIDSHASTLRDIAKYLGDGPDAQAILREATLNHIAVKQVSQEVSAAAQDVIQMQENPTRERVNLQREEYADRKAITEAVGNQATIEAQVAAVLAAMQSKPKKKGKKKKKRK